MADNKPKVKKIKIEATGLGAIKKELKETKDALVSATDPAEIERLIQKAGELKDSIADVNEKINVFATGSKFEATTNAFGEIGKGLATLDFEKAKESATSFAAAAKKITVKDAISSFKDLGSTILKIGKAILTNPLFLIGAIIAAIVIAIVKFGDKIKFLKDILAALGDAIDWVIQLFKDLLDWIGLTDFASEDAAEAQIARNKELIESEKEKSQGVTDALDFEIKKRQANGEDTAKLERQKLVELKRSAYEQAKLLRQIAQATAKLNGVESDEYKEAIKASKDATRQFKLSANEIEVFDIAQKKKKRDADDKAADDAEKNAKDIAKKNSDAAKKAAQEREKYAAERLATSRQIIDLELDLMEDGSAKEIAINKEKYRRIEEDLKTSLKNKKITQDEYNKLSLANTTQAAQNEKKITDEATKEDTEKKLSAQKSYQDLLFSLREESISKTADAIRMAGDEALAIQKENLDKGLITQAEYDAAKVANEANTQAQLDAVLKSYEPEVVETPAQKAQREGEERLAVLQGLLAAGLITEEQFNAKRVASEEKTTKQIADYEKTLAKQKQDAVLSAASSILGGIIANAKEGSAIAKAAGIAQATIDTYKNATSAFGSLSGIPVVGPALGALAAAGAVAAGIANVRKIIATKTPGGGGGGGSAPSAPTATGSVTSNIPSVGLFGKNNGNNQTSTQDVNVNMQPVTVKAVVSETDISNTSNRLSKIKQMSEVG